ncbi:MAG: hypothetical protein U0269_31710 [Polyangiales bacterium]
MSNQEGDNPFWGAKGGTNEEADGESADHDRAAILARRKRFVAAALSSLSLGAAVADCAPTACLSPRPEDAQMQNDVTSQPEAQACLSVARDEGVPTDASDDGAPMPCLDVAPTDGGAGD